MATLPSLISLAIGLAVAGCRFDSGGVRLGERPAAPADRDRPLEAGAATDLLDGPARDRVAAGDHRRADHVRLPDLPRSCQDLFGSVPGFLLCSDTPAACRFYFDLPIGTAKSCTELCSPLACLKMEDNAVAGQCQAENPMYCGTSPCSCASSMNDSICTCAR